jgi:L-fuconolactonase
MGKNGQNIQSKLVYMKIDSHQHFWHYNPVKHNWIDDEMSAIRKDFLPQDLFSILQQNNIKGTVAVQADQTEAETNFLIDLAANNSFIKGVVGWVDLKANNIQERLLHFKKHKIVKGFRHILQSENPDFMIEKKFLNGIAALKEFNFTYDILIFPQHLLAAIELVKRNSNQLFVIDHIAKPSIKSGLIEEWKKGIETIAQFDNVYCKISGMVTETDYKVWQQKDFTPYLHFVVNAFGTKRIMFGSDWPVCQVSASYQQVLSIPHNYFSCFSQSEQNDIFGNNAIKFYQL